MPPIQDMTGTITYKSNIEQVLRSYFAALTPEEQKAMKDIKVLRKYPPTGFGYIIKIAID